MLHTIHISLSVSLAFPAFEVFLLFCLLFCHTSTRTHMHTDTLTAITSMHLAHPKAVSLISRLVCLSVSQSVCLLVSSSICLPAQFQDECGDTIQFVCLSISLSIGMFIAPSVRLLRVPGRVRRHHFQTQHLTVAMQIQFQCEVWCMMGKQTFTQVFSQHAQHSHWTGSYGNCTAENTHTNSTVPTWHQQTKTIEKMVYTT